MVDVTKTADSDTFIRSRLFARDFTDKDDRRDDLFAAPPQLDMRQFLLELFRKEDLKVMSMFSRRPT